MRTGTFTTAIIIKNPTGIGKKAMLTSNSTGMIGIITGRLVTITVTNIAVGRRERI